MPGAHFPIYASNVEDGDEATDALLGLPRFKQRSFPGAATAAVKAADRL